MRKFREDLFYRLSIVPIELPPLRQRLEDIPELVRELISSLENRDQTSVRFNSQALQSLQKHSWPGNVRELANLVERLGIMHPNAVLGVSDLPHEYRYAVTRNCGACGEEAAPNRLGQVVARTVPSDSPNRLANSLLTGRPIPSQPQHCCRSRSVSGSGSPSASAASSELITRFL